MMKSTVSLRRDALRRGGFTLIEVAIALVIFIFGALAIVRIFPPGLGVIQNSGDQLVAVNLNRTTLARYAAQPGLVPDAITEYGTEGAAAQWRDGKLGAVAGSARRNNSLPINNIQDFNSSALGHFRQIYGERHVVSASEVVLTQFPIGLNPPVATPTTSLRAYREDFLGEVKINSAGALDSTNAKNSDGTPYPTTIPAGTKFYVSYRWIEGGKIWCANEEFQSSLNNSANQSVRAGVTFIAGEIEVRVQTPFTPTNIDNDRGAFVATGLAGKTIALDYAVKDWRWMVHEGIPTITPEEPPATMTKPRSINLSVRPLDDTESPYIYTLFTSQYPTLPTPAQFEPNAKAGQVVFDVNTLPTESPRTRIVYRSLDNWAQQLSVAAKNYLLNFGTSSSIIEPWRDCVLVKSSDRTLLYFAASEAGKSVSISYSYDDASATDKVVDGRIFNIKDDILDLNIPAIGNRVSELELTDINGGALSSGTPLTAIQKIQGVSVQTRTAWIDGTRFNQTSTTGFRGTN